jgi:hypothetical protein
MKTLKSTVKSNLKNDAVTIVRHPRPDERLMAHIAPACSFQRLHIARFDRRTNNSAYQYFKIVCEIFGFFTTLAEFVADAISSAVRIIGLMALKVAMSRSMVRLMFIRNIAVLDGARLRT